MRLAWGIGAKGGDLCCVPCCIAEVRQQCSEKLFAGRNAPIQSRPDLRAAANKGTRSSTLDGVLTHSHGPIAVCARVRPGQAIFRVASSALSFAFEPGVRALARLPNPSHGPSTRDPAASDVMGSSPCVEVAAVGVNCEDGRPSGVLAALMPRPGPVVRPCANQH